MIKYSTIILSVLFTINLNASISNDDVSKNSNLDNLSIEVVTTDPPVVIHNASVGIFPGETNTANRKVITKGQLLPMPEDLIVTGIEAAEHGKKLLVIATNGSITFVANNSSSLNDNRIAGSSNMTINQGDAYELTYNGILRKWVITNTNP